MLLCLAFWARELAITRKQIKKGPFFITYPLVGLVLVSLVTSITSADPALSLYHTLRLALLTGFYFYVLNNVASLRKIMWPLATMLGVQAAVAISQVISQSSIGLQAIGEYELNPEWNGVSVVWTETLRSLRGYGLSDHPNILGGCLAFGLLLLAGIYIRGFSRFGQWVLALTAATSGVALLLTFSRSAWLGALTGAGWMIWQVWRSKDRPVLTKAAMLLAACTVALAPFVWQNLELLGVRLGANNSFQELPAEAGSMGERRVLAGAANQLFSENAIMGVGLGATPIAFKEAFPDFPVSYQPAHMALLTAATETGLLGGLFYSVLLAGPWVAIYVARRTRLSLDLVAVSGGLLALTVIGFFDYYTWLLVPGRLLQYLGWGLWARFYSDEIGEKT
jgi:O-antigen ligase